MAAAPKTNAKKNAKPNPKAAVKPVKASTAKRSTGAADKKTTAKKPGDANRRRFDRRDTQISAELEHGRGTVQGSVTNLSLQGCLFTPKLALPVGTRVKLKLSGDSRPVVATIKAVSSRGVHCLLHAGGATLGRLTTDLDDMALLMLKAGRPTTAGKASRAKLKSP